MLGETTALALNARLMILFDRLLQWLVEMMATVSVTFHA
jgi:hypothetical protein